MLTRNAIGLHSEVEVESALIKAKLIFDVSSLIHSMSAKYAIPPEKIEADFTDWLGERGRRR